MTKFLTEADLADEFGETAEKIADWRRRYHWPHFKVGREVRFTESDVEAIVALHHVAGRRRTGLPDQTERSIARAS